MKKLIIVLIAIAFMSATAFAGSTDTQTVYYEIDAINEISMGTDCTLTVDTATAGSQPDADSLFKPYNITTNETAGKKITAVLNSNMPSNVTLSLEMAAPATGASAGVKYLTSTAQDLVTSIETVAESSIQTTLSLSAAVAAGLPADGSRVITYTLTDE
ncbi:MAG: hypothetical protein ABIH00_00515 [Armatimonadota bacterium]